jgi:hypothetical protein
MFLDTGGIWVDSKFLGNQPHMNGSLHQWFNQNKMTMTGWATGFLLIKVCMTMNAGIIDHTTTNNKYIILNYIFMSIIITSIVDLQ